MLQNPQTYPNDYTHRQTDTQTDLVALSLLELLISVKNEGLKQYQQITVLNLEQVALNMDSLFMYPQKYL